MGATLIFGTGKALEHRLDEIPWERVDAFVDNDKRKWGKEFHGRKILSPEALDQMDVRRIYISTTKFFDEIFEQLVCECKIPKEKVKGFSCLLVTVDKKESLRVVEHVADVLISLGSITVYDELDGLKKYGVLSPYDHRLAAWRNTGRWDVVREMTENPPDTVLFVNPFEHLTVVSLLGKMREARKRWDASCVIVASGRWDDESDAWIPQVEKCFSKIIIQQYPFCIVVIARNGKEDASRIYTVTHKPYLPVLWAEREAGYEPIFAGARREKPHGILRDDEGENISFLNGKINECTAIYWIWKHQKQKIVGFSHYRRYFLNRCDAPKKRRCILSSAGAQRYLEDADVLVAQPERYEWDCVAGGIRQTTQAGAFAYGLELIRRNLKRFQPNDLHVFEDVMNGFEMYPCNMFVTRWEIFDAYCTWLFSFLIPAAEEADVSHFDAYSKRIIGFFAERMLTVWLVKHPELRIKTLPILQTDA